jgi:hypothetical protein
MRELAAAFQSSAGAFKFADQATMEFEKVVQRSMADDPGRRRRRLAKARKIPDRVPVVILSFVRNPDVCGGSNCALPKLPSRKALRSCHYRSGESAATVFLRVAVEWSFAKDGRGSLWKAFHSDPWATFG